MKFTKIEFKNFRCYIDGEMDFLPIGKFNKERNIILFQVPNGGGKTQLMLAFRFALYGMSEKEFQHIQGQQDMPYALNSNVYSQLLNSDAGDKSEAMVRLSFKYDGENFTVTRKHIFEKKYAKVVLEREEVTLQVVDESGDTRAYKDSGTIRAIINRIIPEKTLYALLCDGERVKQLSTTGDEANKALNAIIQRMTEHELLDILGEGIHNALAQIRRKVSKNNSKWLNVDVSDIEHLEKDIQTFENSIQENSDKIEHCKGELQRIAEDLRQIEAVKLLAAQRDGLTARISISKRKLESVKVYDL